MYIVLSDVAGDVFGKRSHDLCFFGRELGEGTLMGDGKDGYPIQKRAYTHRVKVGRLVEFSAVMIECVMSMILTVVLLRHMKISPLILAFFVHLSGFAQSIVKPGDALIRYDLIHPSHAFYRVVTTDTTGQVQYDFVNEDYLLVDTPRQQLVFARYRQVPPGSFSTDTSFTDFNLRPIRMHEIHYQRDVSFDMSFEDTLAHVKTTRKGVTSDKAYPMHQGYFEDNMIEYVLGYLDLRKGITYTLDDFHKDTPAPSDPYNITYVFDDVWKGPGDLALTCRVLHFKHGSAEGYVWIDGKTGQMLKEEAAYEGGGFVITLI
jgi:hypothetical protein